MTEAVVGEREFARDPGFDLRAFWDAWAKRFEDGLASIPVTVRVAPGAAAWVERLGNPALRPPADAPATPDGDGWLRRTLVFEKLEYAETALLGFGAAVEVVEPVELRERLRARAAEIAALYAAGLGSGPCPTDSGGSTASSIRSTRARSWTRTATAWAICAGIRARLDHLAWLGIDAIWLSPIFPSPMADFGYDVSNYCDIDPRFGDLARVRRAAGRGARARHPRDARLGPEPHLGPARLVPRVAREPHEPQARLVRLARSARRTARRRTTGRRCSAGRPGSSTPRRVSYYLRSFLKEQPDLNWRNPEVERAMHGVLRFWLDRGVDGFRIDVIHRIAKDPELRDNPPSERPGPGWGGQLHVHDENHPDIHGFLRRIRARARPVRRARGGRRDRPRARPGRDVLRARRRAAPRVQLRLPARALGRARRSPASSRTSTASCPPEGWPDLVLSNHDIPRHATR